MLVDVGKKRKKVIGQAEVEAVVATIARIPPKVRQHRRQGRALATLEADLKRVVFGQDVGDPEGRRRAIKLARAGLRSPEKPIGNYLFSGPTGVGKTEVAKQLASILGIPLTRFDMSEYMERHSVSRLIGAHLRAMSASIRAGLLTDAVDQHPHSACCYWTK